jgi:predicted RNase H-like HicB family nuclease
MLTEYIHAALRRARYEILEDGSFYGAISECPGVWANAESLEECRAELQEVLEEWILLGIARHQSLPVIEEIELSVELAA